jgi:hypothetical protein
MLQAKITHVVLCSVYGLYCVHDILCCIHTNCIVYVWNYALWCMHILYCVYKMYMLYTVAYIECMSTNVYLYVNWIHGVMSERFLFCFVFFNKLTVFYIMVYIEVFFVSLLQISTWQTILHLSLSFFQLLRIRATLVW